MVAAAERALDGEVEKRQIADEPCNLETDTDRPNMLRHERLFLTYDPALVSGRATGTDGGKIGNGYDELSVPPHAAASPTSIPCGAATSPLRAPFDKRRRLPE